MTLKIGIIGYGAVSQAMVKIMHDKCDLFSEKFLIVAVSDNWKGSAYVSQGLDLAKLSALPTAQHALSTLENGTSIADNDMIIEDPTIDILIETTFTNSNSGEPALSYCRRALKKGKHVITTNKGPVALAGSELQQLAFDKQCQFLFEGSVMSGTPTISLIEQCLKGANIKSISGIMNGTSNFILSEMEQGTSFNTALTQAKTLGYAENDSSADIGGSDVALKVMILANQILNLNINYADIAIQGITNINKKDINQAQTEGCCWRLLGHCDANGSASVGPVKLPSSHVLAGIKGATNALLISTDHLGDICISGPGAGREATGYALISDLLSLSSSAV